MDPIHPSTRLTNNDWNTIRSLRFMPTSQGIDRARLVGRLCEHLICCCFFILKKLGSRGIWFCMGIWAWNICTYLIYVCMFICCFFVGRIELFSMIPRSTANKNMDSVVPFFSPNHTHRCVVLFEKVQMSRLWVIHTPAGNNQVE